MAKAFAWSYSKIKNFETCPLKHQQVDLLKNFSEGESEQLKWGDTVHKTFAHILNGDINADGKPWTLPVEMLPYQKWIDKVGKIPGKLYVENKYALDKDFRPTSWFGPSAWYRGIADVVKVAGTSAAVLDWKTGAIKDDPIQLMLMAQCVFSNFPELKRVHTAFVWLQEDTTTPAAYERSDMAEGWAGLFDRVHAYENAIKTNVFQPKPSGLCRKWCPVKTCQFHGKGAF